MSNCSIIRRYAVFGLGLMFSALGVSLITTAGLGTSPITSPALVFSLIFSGSLGVFTFAMNLVLFLGQAALLRREFPLCQWLQLPVTFVFSALIDLFMYVLAFFAPRAYLWRLLVLAVGCAALGLGIAYEVASDVLILPGEGFVKVLASKLGKEFSVVKICFDTTLVALSAGLSFLVLGRVAGVREGTLIAALTVGAFARLFRPLAAGLVAPQAAKAKRGAVLSAHHSIVP